MSEKSNAEAAFLNWINREGIPAPVEEHQFDPTRKWRFDFCWPASKFAVEIDGLLWEGGGRHQRVQGYLKDAEKMESAMVLGWWVYRVPSPWVLEGLRPIWRAQVIQTIRVMLGLAVVE